MARFDLFQTYRTVPFRAQRKVLALVRTLSIVSTLTIAVALSACSFGGKADLLPVILPLFVVQTVFNHGAIDDVCEGHHSVTTYLYGCDGPEPAITPDNANDRDLGECLLTIAASKGNLRIFRKLLDNGAEIRRCNAEGFYKAWMFPSNCEYPPEAVATTEEFLNLVESLGIAVKDEQDLLIDAVDGGCVSAIRFFVNHGANVNLEDEFGYRPLDSVFSKAEDSHFEAAKVLIELGADPSLRNRQGQTSLEFARLYWGKAPFWPKVEAALTKSP